MVADYRVFISGKRVHSGLLGNVDWVISVQIGDVSNAIRFFVKICKTLKPKFRVQYVVLFLGQVWPFTWTMDIANFAQCFFFCIFKKFTARVIIHDYADTLFLLIHRRIGKYHDSVI